MRFDVHTVRCHLVNALIDTPQVKEVWHDGSDVVILDFKTGESIAIHLVERFMSVDEISYIFNHNAEQGHYTLLVLWADMFMPSDGQVFEPLDWMYALLQLYGGKIYAYDAWRDEPYIFRVHFQPIENSHKYLVRHGQEIAIHEIGIDTIETTMSYFRGFWRVARFDGFVGEWQETFWEPPTQNGANSSVRFYFNLLGLPQTASREAVKLAYRELARKHHPDLNPTADSTQRMQQINDAYQRILRYLDEDAAS